MKAKVGLIVFKLSFIAAFLRVFYVQKEHDIDLNSQEDQIRFVKEFEAREDAFEKEPKPLIERNRLMDLGSSCDTVDAVK